ncbi:MAG: hypothetical protein V5A22_08445 [Salinivenus sp.]
MSLGAGVDEGTAPTRESRDPFERVPCKFCVQGLLLEKIGLLVVQTSLHLSMRSGRIGGESEPTLSSAKVMTSRPVILDALIENSEVDEKCDPLSRLRPRGGLVCFQVVLNRGRKVSEEIVQVATILMEGGDPLCSQRPGRIAGGNCVCVGNGVLKGLEGLRELLESSVKDSFPVQRLNEGG